MTDTRNKKIWFKRKKFGWGWVPASIEGWAVVIIYAVSFIYILESIDFSQDSSRDILIIFLPRLIVLTLILIAICYAKGEKPKWTWGE